MSNSFWIVLAIAIVGNWKIAIAISIAIVPKKAISIAVSILLLLDTIDC